MAEPPSPRILGLSLWQPWAGLLACGAKRIETRDWSTTYRGWVAIHATKTSPDKASDYGPSDPLTIAIRAAAGGQLWDQWQAGTMPCGAVVGVGLLYHVGRINREADGRPVVYGERYGDRIPVGAHEAAFGDYTPGRYGWCFSSLLTLREPVPCKGAQRLWRVPDEVVVALRREFRQQGRAA